MHTKTYGYPDSYALSQLIMIFEPKKIMLFLIKHMILNIQNTYKNIWLPNS